MNFTGVTVNPSNTPIYLNTGWNMISYLRNSPMSPIAAFASISSSLLMVKDGNGHVYWSQWGVDDIGSLIPGRAYNIFVSQPVMLIYPGN